jgi:hypothetical protein
VGIAVFGTQKTDAIRTGTGSRLFFFVLLLLVGGAILRSAIATRLDDFTYDFAYHIAAGTSYVQRADFRLNPEHPPLVKLWVGGLMAATGFALAPSARLTTNTMSAPLQKRGSNGLTMVKVDRGFPLVEVLDEHDVAAVVVELRIGTSPKAVSFQGASGTAALGVAFTIVYPASSFIGGTSAPIQGFATYSVDGTVYVQAEDR